MNVCREVLWEEVVVQDDRLLFFNEIFNFLDKGDCRDVIQFMIQC